RLDLSIETINIFFERHDIQRYKFDIDLKGNVFIVEVEKAVHASVIEVPKGAYYQLREKEKPSAPDIAIYLSLNIIPKS
ncbi:4520_t:CDS:2, partial [Funneliformis mosseae]